MICEGKAVVVFWVFEGGRWVFRLVKVYYGFEHGLEAEVEHFFSNFSVNRLESERFSNYSPPPTSH